MSKQISIDKIINATLSGIEKSQQQYEKWSGGLWLWAAPEYFITVNVAAEISKIGGPQFITLENGSKTMIEDAGARGRGRLPKDIREKGRVDILIWWGNDRPRAAIEIKNFVFDSKQYEKDIRRIKEFLKLNSEQSSLQFGLFGYCDSADDGKHKNAKQKIEDKQIRIENKIIDILGVDFRVLSESAKIHEIQESAWCATCVLIIKHKQT
jgi:hypothetical protein